MADPDSIQPIPIARIRFSEEETAELVEFGLANQLSLNSVVAAAILLAEWELRKTPHIPIPYIYPVDLRYLLSPPVSRHRQHTAAGGGDLSRGDQADTDVVDLARGIVDSFRTDLSDGVIQQSALHFNLQYQGTPAGTAPGGDGHRHRHHPTAAHA